MVLIRKLNQIFNFTLSAASAVSNITRDLNLAIKILNAVREEDQKFIGPDPTAIRSDEMVVQFDKRLPNFFFRYTDDLAHQDHKREKDFRNQAPELMRQEDILPPHDGEDKQETAENHQEDKKGQGEAEDQREGGVNVSQPHDGNIPEEKDESKENHTGKDKQSNEDSLLRLNSQGNPLVNSNIRTGNSDKDQLNLNKF
jgi:hypothetical protein